MIIFIIETNCALNSKVSKKNWKSTCLHKIQTEHVKILW